MSLSKCTKLIILVLRSPLYPLCSLPCQAEFRLSTHQGLRQRTKVIIKNDWEIELANKFQDRYFLLLQIPARLCKKRCLPFAKKHTTFSLKGCILFRKSMCPFRKKKKILQHVVVRVKAKRNTAFRIYVNTFAPNRRRTRIVYANLCHCCITEKNHLPL